MRKLMSEDTVGDVINDFKDGTKEAAKLATEAARKGGEAAKEAALNTPMSAVWEVIGWGLVIMLFLAFVAWIGRD
jgi:hypothetical protein